MSAAWKKAAPLAALTLAAVTLAACIVEPVPTGGGEAYYAQPAPVYVGPRYYYGPGYYGGYRDYHGWRGGGHHWH